MTSSLWVWMSALTVSIVLLVLSAALKTPYVHMLVTAIMAISLALVALRESRLLRAAGKSASAIASSNARFMGYVWTWCAIALFMTYNFVLSWKEWLPFFFAFVVAAGVCLYFSSSLNTDEAAGTSDPIMKKIGRYLTIAQVVGMLIVIVGLIVDGKMARFAKARPGWEDWAANNIFFFGAAALLAIGLDALINDHRTAKT